MRHVLVVGSGIAGTAAALAAARAGASVSLVASGPGASSLSGGAVDLDPWESANARVAPLGREERAIVDLLGSFRVAEEPALVATLAGILRPARGADLALLDLATLHDAEVLVPDFQWRSWDAAALSRAWSDAPEARARRLQFTPAAVQLIRHHEEHDLPDADMAARHDSPERLAWLGDRLVAAKKAAVVLPPWLGVARSRASSLRERLGVPCGEAVATSGGPSGLRFENARDRALAAAGVERASGRVSALARAVGSWRARLESGEELGADAVVLATGGLVGGGLAYSPIASTLATDANARAGPLVRATVDAPLVVGMHDAPLAPPSSLLGAPPESHAWPYVDEALMDRAGILVDEDGRVRSAPDALFAAGEAVADRPRTWLDALASGVAAGGAAART